MDDPSPITDTGARAPSDPARPSAPMARARHAVPRHRARRQRLLAGLIAGLSLLPVAGCAANPRESLEEARARDAEFDAFLTRLEEQRQRRSRD